MSLAKIALEHISGSGVFASINRNFQALTQLAVDLNTVRQGLADALGGEHIIRGTVNFDATVITGTGFSVATTATGDYTVTFTTAFSAAPTVVVTGANPATNQNIAALKNNPSTGSVGVLTFGFDPSTNDIFAANRDFTFIAIGPA